MTDVADGSWCYPTLFLRKQKIWFLIFAWHKKQLYGIALAVHNASSHTEKKLGGACDSRFRITIQL